jgi:hypothetical protein
MGTHGARATWRMLLTVLMETASRSKPASLQPPLVIKA